MLNPHVLLCENPPRFKAAILGSFVRQRFLFSFVFTVDFVSRFHPVFFPSCPLVMIAGCLSTLPRNAATVSSSKTELKIIKSWLKDSEEKLYQPPDSGGKYFSFFFVRFFFKVFSIFNLLHCARDFHLCVNR